MPASYTAFYEFADTGESVTAEEGRRVDGAYVLRELLGRLRNDADFLGLIDDRDTTLQLLYDAGSNTYWAEIPVVAEKGSYGAWLSFHGVVALIQGLPSRFEVPAFPGFSFQRFGVRN